MSSHPGRGKARQVDQSDEEEADVNMKSDNDSDSQPHLYSDSDPPPPPKGFCSLPLEIRERILILACGLPRVHHRRDPGLSTQCTKTINRLSLVNRALYTQMMPILYENVRLTRPSDLRIFHTTVTARPALGQYVKRLHVGAVEPFSEDWMPIFADKVSGRRQLRIALVDRPLEELNMPSWLCPTHAFDLAGKPKTSLDKVLRAAIQAASRDLDVNILYDHSQGGYCEDYSGNDLCNDLWYIRVFEVQAAFELYLSELGRLDQTRPKTEQEGEDSSSRPPYPRLAIHPGSALREEEVLGENVFWLSRSRIMEHTTRRRARTDHFNHALLLSRSGMPWNYMDPGPRGHLGDAGLIGDEDVGSIDGGTPEFVDVCFRARLTGAQMQVIDFIDAGVVMPRVDVTNPLDTGLPNVATVGGISALTRSVLSFTPFVQSLSFTGYLERIIGGVRPPPSLPFLRSLTLGPPIDMWWRNPLRLNHATLATVENLRICGKELAEEEMGFIAGKEGALPELKAFRWSHLTGLEEYRWTFEEAITKLASIGYATATDSGDGADAGRKRQRRSEDGEEEGSSDDGSKCSRSSFGARKHQLYIEARLNSEDFKEVMDKVAPTTEVREAWRSGAVLPNSKAGNRFKVVAGVDVEVAEKWTEAVSRKVDWTMMDESRKWWEFDGTDL